MSSTYISHTKISFPSLWVKRVGSALSISNPCLSKNSLKHSYMLLVLASAHRVPFGVYICGWGSWDLQNLVIASHIPILVLGHWEMHSWHPFGIAWCHDEQQCLEAFKLLQVLSLVHMFLQSACPLLQWSLRPPILPSSLHHAIFILLVAENPLGANDICIGPFHQGPCLISFIVVELFLHSHDPIRIFKFLFYLERFQWGN
jgi:hypothetical protein